MNRRFKFLLTCGLAAGMLSVGAAVASAAPSFQGLGFLPGGVQSQVFGVSADGSVVVGDDYNGVVFEAFRWDAAGGMVGLGHLSPSIPRSQAFAASADGSIIVGASFNSGGGAFRWDATSGMVALGGGATIARDVSADGSVVVGERSTAGGFEAIRWDAASGVVGLGMLPGDSRSTAFAASADGSVVVGVSETGGFPPSATQAFRWDATDGMVGLGFLPGDNASLALDVSADGSVIVGGSREAGISFSDQAFRWDAASGMVGLGFLPGGNFSIANAVSADGSVIVGLSGDSNEFNAFIWDAAHDMRSLQDVLVNDYGLDLTGWTLGQAIDISADGRTIVGTGPNPDGRLEAWIVTIPEPATCWLALLAAAAMMAARRTV